MPLRASFAPPPLPRLCCRSVQAHQPKSPNREPRQAQDEYAINLQSGKKPYHEGDRAGEPLFTYVKDYVFEKPTYATFLKLLVRSSSW